jgi:adenosine deaminase/aminodeoxyfutalosine deaminase
MARSELHLHLEGSIDPDTVRLLDPSLTLPEIEHHFDFSDFAGFLQSFKWIAQRLRTPEDYGTITTRLLDRLEQQGIAYAELTLAAGVVIWKKQDLTAIYEAVRQAALDHPAVEVHWNLDSIRQFGPELAMQVVEFAIEQRERGVISIGIGGDEASGPAHWFTDVYSIARKHGLRLTAHAGETAGPESIWSALAIGAERIGHGIRAIDDPVLVAHLRDRQIPLEICITSNVMTGAVPSLDAHPVRRLFDAGVPITLNTDDPGIFRTTLQREFEIARTHFGFTGLELESISRNAMTYRFAGGDWPQSEPHPEASAAGPKPA